jgi:hypothetical protein
MKTIDSIGRGLVAGLAGTAAMTVSSTLEARLRGRAPSTAPARATAKVLGIKEFDSDLASARFNDLSHWGYGTSWGIVRGLLAAAGLSPAAGTLAPRAPGDRAGRPAAPGGAGRAPTLAHGAAVYGAEQVTLPALDVAPPAIFWSKTEIAIDAFHHAVYAVATGLAYGFIDGAARR